MKSGKKIATFQQRFADLFDESKKTIKELSKELHVSNQTISAWKTGSRSPKEPTIIAIANYFGVTEKWLMGFDVEKWKSNKQQDPIYIDEPPKNDDVRLLMKGLNKRSPEEIKQVLDVVRIMFKNFDDKESDDET